MGNTQAILRKGMGAVKDLFDYFEGLDEAVYISDIETNEIIFMNRCLRKTLGYTEKEAYKGEKCHKVLQGSDSPCIFCNNQELRAGKFTVWAHENPVLNQRYVIRDTLTEFQGRKYRVEVATAMDQSGMEKAAHYFTRKEAVLNECLQIFFSTSDPEHALERLLQYLGETFGGDRTYIFEVYEDRKTSNTYEWCASGGKSQIDILQDLPLSDLKYWIQVLEKEEILNIPDIGEIRKTSPATYAFLKSQKIKSLVVSGIQEEGSLKGFIGMNNPAQESVFLLEQVIKELGKYMIPQLKRRDLYRRLNKMSYQDLLTGAYNHNAMFEHNMLGGNWKSFGTIYCDINGLKETNDTQGHSAGNALIQKCYQVLKKSLHTEWIYRVGGDEFVALYYDVGEDMLKKEVEGLRLAAMQSMCQISIGSAWSDQIPIDTDQVLNDADTQMYKEKEQYYANLVRTIDETVQKTVEGSSFSANQSMADYQIKLRRFLSNTYCDLSFFLTILGNDTSTSYFFFGDMQKNLFFISENMRKKFGFENNIVSDLINRWAERIVEPHLLKRFWDDINAMLENRKDYHDLRYQIADAQGKKIWIRCFGKIKWNESGTKPLFFAGRMTQQEEGFVVDALTNFPTETALEKQLECVQESGASCQAIGFSFHNITQINNNHGRSYGDCLIRAITRELTDKLADRLKFYRLSGMRCLALAECCSEDDIEALIYQIKEVIDHAYQEQGIALQYTCSFARMYYPQDGVSPQDFIENMISLIKVAHQSPAQLYIDDSAGNIKKMQQISSMESCLMENIINGMMNFRIVVQPVVSTQNGLPIGGETLLRWRFRGEEISPGVFIPIMENEHMIHLVGRWVFEQAVRSCVRILTYAPDFYLTVNVSLQQLEDESFIVFIEQTLRKYELDGEHIVMELTESCMDDQPEKLEQFVKACENLNIRIALDDFGSGYSSLRVLLRYPSNIIKLDRSLLVEMSDSFEKNGFITSIVYACHQFGKKVCMEGVETDFQDEIVKESGCDLIQGFYYYRPMELEQLYRLLAEQYEEN